MNKSEKRMSGFCLFVFLAAVFVMFSVVIIFQIKASRDDKKYYEENRKTVAALEEEDISNTEKDIKNLENRDRTKKDRMDADGNMVIRDNVELKRAFQGTVIVGDSFVEPMAEYGFLGADVIFYKRGCSISQAEEMLEDAVSLIPSAMFLIFGSNDLELYQGDSQRFIQEYKKQLDTLRNKLPDTKFYINSIIPCTQEAVETDSGFAYWSEFNEALLKMCQENDYVYVNCDFLAEDQENSYEPDGIHLVKECYPRWLSYLADIAGL